MTVSVVSTSGPVAAGDDEVTLDTFLDGCTSQVLKFRPGTWASEDILLPTKNTTILEAEFKLTAVAGDIPSDDVMDFSTHSVGDDLWASENAATGIAPPTVDPYNSTWTGVGSTDVANIDDEDGVYWSTETPTQPTVAPFEWPVQVYHFRYDDVTNVSEIDVVWNGIGICDVNGTFKYQAESYMYSHRTNEWFRTQGCGGTWSKDYWMNYTLQADSLFISANGSIDVAIVGPHAEKNANGWDYGHLKTDYMGIVAKIPSGSTEYPEDVEVRVDDVLTYTRNGAFTGSVVLNDAQGLKGTLQAHIDRQPDWANDTVIEFDVEVGKVTYGKINISDLRIVYTSDGTIVPNLPPRWNGTQVMSVEEDSGWTTVMDLDAAFTDDHDQGGLIFSVEQVNVTWLQARVDWNTGANRTLEVKAAPDRWGDASVTVSATDLDGATGVSPPLLVYVTPVPDAPVIQMSGTMTAMEGVPFRTTVQVDDPDLPADVLTYSDDSDLFDVDPEDGTIDWTPAPEDVGTHTCTVTVTDLMGLSDSAQLTIRVDNVNDPPVITSADHIDALEGDLVTYQIVAKDPDTVHGDVLTYTAWSLLLDVHVDTATGEVTFQLPHGTVGTVQVLLTAMDRSGASAQLTLQVDVANVNDPPTIEPLGPVTCHEGDQVSARIIYDDPDLALDPPVPEGLTLSTTGPEWLAPDGEGWVRFTAGQTHVGEHLVTYTVTDAAGLTASTDVLWTVINVNDGPVIVTQVPVEMAAMEGEAFSFSLEATDEDGDALSWADDSDMFEIDPVTGTISFTPTQADVGAHPVTVTVSDGNGGSASVTFGLVVENVNDAPVIVTVLPEDGTVYQENEMVRFSVVATDLDGDQLTIRWMEGEEELGAGTPFIIHSLSAGTHTVTLVVTDGTATVERTVDVVILADGTVDDDEGGLPLVLIALLLMGMVTAGALAYMLLLGRKAPERPMM